MILKSQLMAAIPPRFYRELIEIPVSVLVIGMLLSVFFARLQDVLPFVAFSEARRLEMAESKPSFEA